MLNRKLKHRGRGENFKFGSSMTHSRGRGMFLRSKCDINSDWTGVRELAKKGANIVGSEHGLVVDPNDISSTNLIVCCFKSGEKLGGAAIWLNS